MVRPSAHHPYATNLVPDDEDNWFDIYLYDRHLGTTERVSVAPDGAHANYNSSDATLSYDGRYVAFVSSASNLVESDTNGTTDDVFVRDRGAVRPAYGIAIPLVLRTP